MAPTCTRAQALDQGPRGAARVRPQVISDDPLCEPRPPGAPRDRPRRAQQCRAQTGGACSSLCRRRSRRDCQARQGQQTKVLDETTGQVRYVEEPGWRHREDAVAFKIGGKPHYIVFNDVTWRRPSSASTRISSSTLLRPMAALINFAKSMWTHYQPRPLSCVTSSCAIRSKRVERWRGWPRRDAALDEGLSWWLLAFRALLRPTR
jgi:hypothetical protein